MAKNKTPTQPTPPTRATKEPVNPALRAVQIIGSLRATVILFVLSLLLVFFGTVVQTYYGIDRVMKEYFHSWVVHIEFRLLDTFFERFFQDFGYGKAEVVDINDKKEFATFPFPGGFTIGWAMVINLTAAHVAMFIKLYKQYQTAQRQADRQRELNPNTPQTPATGTSLFSKLLFARSGIYIIHIGVTLLLFGEFIRATKAEEARMTIYEGQSIGFTEDFHKTELAIIDVTDPNATTEDVVVIPHQHLVEAARDKNPKAEAITHPDIPFSIEVQSWYRNTTTGMKPKSPDDPTFAYQGQRATVYSKPEVSGTDAREVDTPAVTLRLKDTKTGQDLGLKQFPTRYTVKETITSGDRKYSIQLRFLRTYKDYTVTLHKIETIYYPGTEKAKAYESDVTLNDEEQKENRTVHIWMNHPLRHRGDTLYQSGAPPKDHEGKRYTVLQVVTNPGSTMPYWSCALVTLGMLIHFLMKLFGYTMKELDRVTASPTKAEVVPTSKLGGKCMWAIPAVFFILCALMVGGKFISSGTPKEGEFDYTTLGKIPVQHNGRVQPLDSLARSTLMVLSDGKQEFVESYKPNPVPGKPRTGKEPVGGVARPAMQFFMETASGTDRILSHEIFRVHDPDLLQLLALPDRPNWFRYSIRDFSSNFAKVFERAASANRKEKHQRNSLDVKCMELARNVNALSSIGSQVDPGIIPTDAEDGKWLSLGEIREKFLPELDAEANNEVDGVIEKKEGMPKSAIVAKFGQKKLDEYRERQIQEEMAVMMSKFKVSQEAAYQQASVLVDQQIAKINVGELIESLGKGEYDREAKIVISDLMETKFKNKLQAEYPQAAAYQDLLDSYKAAREKQIEYETMMTLAKDSKTASSVDPSVLSKLKTESASMISRFNDLARGYVSKYGSDAEGKFDSKTISLIEREAKLNRFDPFLQCEVLYVVMFLLAVTSWFMTWKPSLARAFVLASVAVGVLTFGVHSWGLISRMIIVGRPPVTNLYSSAIFIGWGAILVCFVLEIFTRRAFAAAAGSAIGFATMIIARNLAVSGDTLEQMEAVLDTNFWLATHVVIVTLGYVAALKAGAMGLTYLTLGMSTPALRDKDVSRGLSNSIYGTVCFGMILSFVGTVLGGIWADQSWGRFWGWDPKENGAVLVVIWNALILHARWAGLIRQRGMAIMSILGAAVTVWSWFGTNQLGIGLHAYGFNATLATGCAVTWVFCVVFSIVGLMVPTKYWMSFRPVASKPVQKG